MSFGTHFLRNKQSSFVELEIHLFEDCNLSCGFCCQDHGEGISFDYDEKIKLASHFINEKRKTNKNFRINIMGGELFQDEIDSFSPYTDFLSKLSNLFVDGESVEYFITSNLIFNNKRAVLQTIKEMESSSIKVKLNTSFDFAGRNWNGDQKTEFKDNLIFFKNYISSVSVTLHRPGIQNMLKRRNHLFEYIYDNFEVNFDWYVPDLINGKVFCPSDLDCKNALIFLANNYPKSHPVSDYLNNSKNNLQCCSKNRLLIAANNSISSCQYLDYDDNDFVCTPNKLSSEKISEQFITDQGCLSCEYFEKCGLYCFVAADYIKRKKDTKECFIKEFFDEVTVV